MRRGMSPSLWATASSCITDEFSSITTSSIASVGTSLIASLRSEFTYCLGILLNLTTILSSDFSTTSTDGEANTCESRPKRP
ncbi:50S ribosomal protein L18e [Candidatus Nitrososphaera gargensis Ga9.2]|uniref:50S ribosomal protein L18e n=1 Tax=Nitrososphaera gargensis (strain Ga9.2) TaxID=1237085 RepID=K0ING1_NITGG|nr:50S ribosomal protein L18e [Candidatus Nitrososphaera gargensis Ga9.2]